MEILYDGGKTLIMVLDLLGFATRIKFMDLKKNFKNLGLDISIFFMGATCKLITILLGLIFS